MQLYCGINGSLGKLGHVVLQGCTARDHKNSVSTSTTLVFPHQRPRTTRVTAWLCWPKPARASCDPGRETFDEVDVPVAETEDKRRIVDDSHTVMVMGVSIN
jgi:hypothetical protein